MSDWRWTKLDLLHDRGLIFDALEGRETSTAVKLPELSYRDGESWKPLSPWMRFFLELGRSMIDVEEPSARLVLGVTVPTRAYAAVLTAAGAVLALAEREEGPTESAEGHFEYLASLPDGTSVTWHTARAKRKLGWLAGVKEYGGHRVLMIQTSMKGGLKEACHVRDCLGVQPVGEDVLLPRGDAKGKPLAGTIRFLATLVPSESLLRFLSQTATDCLILGVRRWVVDEARCGEIAVSVPSQSRPLMFSLGTVLRLNDPHKPAEASRTVAIAEPSGFAGTPRAVIYDGPRPYLRWRHLWRSQPSILILDRSDRRAVEAADVMNEEFLTRRVATWEIPTEDFPDGIEAMGYLVGVSR